MKRSSWWLAAWAIALWAGSARAEDYKHFGPIETLDNGVVEVQVAPKIGRIISFHRKGGAEWLQVFDKESIPSWHWNPWGGDRIWPTAQVLNPQVYHNNGWDPVIDGQPWEILRKTPTSLEMRSGMSPELGLQITRRIELGPGATVTHTFRLQRVAASAVPIHAWVDTGVQKGDAVWMESDRMVPHPDFRPFKWWAECSPLVPKLEFIPGTKILRVPWPDHNQKLGTYGRWLALLRGSSAFRQSIRYDASALYLDASSLQAFFSPERSIFELETLSPTWFLNAGESREWTVTWDLIDFPEKATDEERARLLQPAEAKS